MYKNNDNNSSTNHINEIVTTSNLLSAFHVLRNCSKRVASSKLIHSLTDNEQDNFADGKTEAPRLKVVTKATCTTTHTPNAVSLNAAFYTTFKAPSIQFKFSPSWGLRLCKVLAGRGVTCAGRRETLSPAELGLQRPAIAHFQSLSRFQGRWPERRKSHWNVCGSDNLDSGNIAFRQQ